MTAPTDALALAPAPAPSSLVQLAIPMGFATQMKVVRENQRVLEETQLEMQRTIEEMKLEEYQHTAAVTNFVQDIWRQQSAQAERITFLEHENSVLRAANDNMQNLLARIDALERHNAVLDGRRREAVSTLLNLRTLHQEAHNAFQIRALEVQPDDLEGMLCVYGTSVTSVMNHHQRAIAQLRPTYMVPTQHHAGSAPLGYAYPAGYTPAGYCTAHGVPYPCRMCGQ